jgi:hypothetical protein
MISRTCELSVRNAAGTVLVEPRGGPGAQRTATPVA